MKPVQRKKRSYRRNKKGRNPKIKKTVVRMLTARGIGKPEIKNNIIWQNGGLLALTASSPGVRLDPSKQGDNDIIYNGMIYPTLVAGGNVIGNSITGKYIHIKGNLYNSGDEPRHVRIMIVCDRQYNMNGYTLVPFSNANVASNANIFMSADANALFHPGAKKRFDVLFNRIYTLSGQPDSNNVRLFEKRINLNNVKITYTQSGANTEELLTDNRIYYLYAWCIDNQETVFYQYTVDFGFVDV